MCSSSNNKYTVAQKYLVTVKAAQTMLAGSFSTNYLMAWEKNDNNNNNNKSLCLSVFPILFGQKHKYWHEIKQNNHSMTESLFCLCVFYIGPSFHIDNFHTLPPGVRLMFLLYQHHDCGWTFINIGL